MDLSFDAVMIFSESGVKHNQVTALWKPEKMNLE